jgi:hypothetical protein
MKHPECFNEYILKTKTRFNIFRKSVMTKMTLVTFAMISNEPIAIESLALFSCRKDGGTPGGMTLNYL